MKFKKPKKNSQNDINKEEGTEVRMEHKGLRNELLRQNLNLQSNSMEDSYPLLQTKWCDGGQGDSSRVEIHSSASGTCDHIKHVQA